MKIYFIRHAPTQCNLTGTMVNGYENVDIINIKPTDWDEKVGIHISEKAHKLIVSSPTRRCIQTSSLLFNRVPDSLGDKKFWEVNETEFNNLVKLTPSDLADKAHKILFTLNNACHDYNTDECIAITHGMVIRYMWNYLNGHQDASAYSIINSVNFKFANLDLMIVDTVKQPPDVYHSKAPINHKK